MLNSLQHLEKWFLSVKERKGSYYPCSRKENRNIHKNCRLISLPSCGGYGILDAVNTTDETRLHSMKSIRKALVVKT